MRIVLLLPLACAALARADAPQEVIDLFGSMASALSESNPGVFLRAIDPSMSGYGRFASAIEALATQNSLSNSIEITKQEGDDRVQVVELDWLLEITGKSDSHVFVRREGLVKCRLEKRKNKWRIVAIDPTTLFAPPSSDAH
jgi:hypothetical protein